MRMIRSMYSISKSAPVHQMGWHSTISRARVAFGALVTIEAAPPPNAADVHAALGRAFTAIARTETLMHPSREASDVARVNAAAEGDTLAIDPDVWRMIELSQQLNRASDGVFDPCLPAALGLIVDLALQDDSQVTVRRKVALDLGGIAKGFAVDLAIESLRSSGCPAAFVNAGGDVRTFGDGEKEVWLRRASGAVTRVAIANEALAFSETLQADAPREHRGYYIRQAMEHSPALFAAVAAPQAAIADALTKVVLLARPACTQIVLDTFGATQLAP
jgi:thiamine biosynthesis lipoprotein